MATKKTALVVPSDLTHSTIAAALSQRVHLAPTVIAGQVVSENEEADKALVVANSFEIDGSKSAGRAADILRAIKAAMERTERSRKVHTDPLDEAKRAVMNLFQVPFLKMQQAQLKLTAKLTVWRRAEEKRLTAEAEAKRKEIAEKARLSAAAQAALGDAEGAKQIVEEAAALKVEVEKPTAVGIYGGSVGSRSRSVGSVADRRKFLQALLTSELPAMVEILDGITFPQISLNRLAALVEKGEEISPPGFSSEKAESTVIR